MLMGGKFGQHLQSVSFQTLPSGPTKSSLLASFGLHDESPELRLSCQEVASGMCWHHNIMQSKRLIWLWVLNLVKQELKTENSCFL